MADKVHVSLPNGEKLELERGATGLDLARAVSPRLERSAVGVLADGKLKGLREELPDGAAVRVLTFEDPEGRRIYWHTTAHMMAQAVCRLYPGVLLGIGPSVEDGFYYDFDVKTPFSPEDLERIEKAMADVQSADYPITMEVLDKEEARRLFKDQPYKLELLEEIDDETVTVFRQGEFYDLCAGPHLPSTGVVRHFKLLSVAGAYWRGDEKRPMLQRIYGVSYPEKSELLEHVRKIEEARRRDHRRLGRELDMFSIHDEAGAGLVFWHPKGGFIRETVENFWRKEHRKRGYDIVYSPHIAKIDLWKISGHWDWYKDSMYSPMDIDGLEYLLKPMNCPFHILMYKSQTRSYRDLPLRWGELGTVYRYERSGVLHGLLRVRGFTQDDAHLFCRPDQLEDEIVGVIDLALFMMKSFGYSNYSIMLSVRDLQHKEKYIGDDLVWDNAESALVAAMGRMGLEYRIGEGEAKFYGPAIDITLNDALGRGWQGPTIQVDFNLPERFDMTYMGEDNRPHRPVMIHRTVLGSMERFVGGLIEHYAGAMPMWLSPVQVKVLPITEKQVSYAHRVKETLAEAGLRPELDARNEKIGYKIRQAELEKVPYMLIIGQKEMDANMVAVRKRREGDLGPMELGEFIKRAEKEVADHV